MKVGKFGRKKGVGIDRIERNNNSCEMGMSRWRKETMKQESSV